MADQKENVMAKSRLNRGLGINEAECALLLREIVERDFDSLRSAAKKWRMSAAHLSDILRGRRGIGPKAQTVLGLRRVVKVEYFAPAATQENKE